MSIVIDQFLSEITAAWYALTGKPLSAWNGVSEETPLPFRRSWLQEDLPYQQVEVEGTPWIVARSQLSTPPFYLASPDPGGAACHLLPLLVTLLDQLTEEQVASRQLTEELLAAWNRLNFLFDMARIAVQSSELPPMFTHLARSLLQVMPAEDVCLLLDEGEQVEIYTASGNAMPGLENIAPFALQGAGPIILQRGKNLPASVAEALPSLRNMVVLPMPLDASIRGVLGLINHPTGELKAGDRQLLLSAVEQISMLVSSSLNRAIQEANRRLDHELTIASQIQENFLPNRLPNIPGMEFAASLKPAHMIGGDFYDVQPVADGLAIMVGDVAGKGIPAAMLTALIHATLKSEAQHHPQPADLLRSINRLIYEELDRSDTFITTFLAVIQTNPLQLTYASAGHTTTLLWRSRDQDVVQLGSTGLPLGISPQIEIEQNQIPLDKGDVLVLYSDGITEAENEQGRVFGMQALVDLLLATHTAGAEEQMRMILAALDLHRGKLPLRDDVVLFLARAEQPQPGPVEVVPFVYTAEKRNVRSLAILTRQAASRLDYPMRANRSQYLNELELAVSEIAANVVVHSYKDHPFTGRLQGRITIYPERVCIDLIDNGATFEPDFGAKDARPRYSLIDPPTGGYGLILARRLLDVCQYAQLPSGRNHWHLEKFLSGPTPSAAQGE